MKRIISRGKAVIGEAELVTSRLRQAAGLMFSRQKNLIFVLPRERTLLMHMLFVFYSIDVVGLNSQKKVMELIPGFRPFTFYRLKNRCRFILELRNATIEKAGLKPGDSLSF
jgi:uncharacterized membrane protein (UPF0127 family)